MPKAKQRPVFLDFEMPLRPVRELKRPPRKMKEGRVYLVPSELHLKTTPVRVDETAAVYHWDPDVIYLLCPCGCGNRITIPMAAPYQISRAEPLGLTITPEVYVSACKTRFIVAHNMIYGKCPFPPQKMRDEPRKEIVLKFGKAKCPK